MTNYSKTRNRACTGKRGYSSESTAEQTLERQLAQTGGSAGVWNVYRCPAGCGYWHIGHVYPSDRRR